MDEEKKKLVKVSVSEDSMQAFIYITSPIAGLYGTDLTFTIEEITSILSENGVSAGIDKSMLHSIIIEKMYDQYHLIAKGKLPVNGTDGYYTFHFKTEIDNKPKINEDGSVDYRNIDIYEPVKEGQELITYTPATSGFFGFDVRGTMLPCVRGKDLPTIKGTGFTLEDDNRKYISNSNGKVEFANDKLTVTNILDMSGDVDLTTGDITFEGDVIIHGSVLSGVNIHAGGSLTIMGNVEAANLFAGGDIELKSGMQGGAKGTIQCDSNVWGKFFEQVNIRVHGDLHANSIMNCVVESDSNVIVNGRHGAIVGGSITAQGNVEASVLGNLSEVNTQIFVGVNQGSLKEISLLEYEIKQLSDALAKQRQVLEKLDAVANPVDREKFDQMHLQVEATIASTTEQYALKNSELQQKLFLISTYSSSRVIVHKYVYPRVVMMINGIHYQTTDAFNNVTFKDTGGVVQIIDNV